MRHVVLCVQNLSVPQDPRVWREARTLHAAGYRVSVVCPLGPNHLRREEIEGVTIHRYRAPVDATTKVGYVVETACALVWSALLILRLHVRHRVAVVHAANPPDTYFLLGWLVRPLGIRFVYDQHDHCPELMAEKWRGRQSVVRLLRVLERLSMRSAHLVVTTNDSSRRAALSRASLPEPAVVTVRNGPEHSLEGDLSAPHATASGNGVLRIAYAGRMGTEDGVDLLLDAGAELAHRYPGRLRLDLIGAGEDVTRLRRKVADLGLVDVVEWAGWLDSAALHQRLRQATIAVAPESDNTFTQLSTMTKVSEYLALGLPVVAADMPETRVTAGDAARYFKPGDRSALSATLERLLLNPGERVELSARARKRAAQLLWTGSAERLTAAYQWLLEGGPPVLGNQLAEAR